MYVQKLITRSKHLITNSSYSSEFESRTQDSRPRPRTQKQSEAKAKNSLSQGQGQECSRPRTKDTGASVLGKKFFSSDLQKKFLLVLELRTQQGLLCSSLCR